MLSIWARGDAEHTHGEKSRVGNVDVDSLTRFNPTVPGRTSNKGPMRPRLYYSVYKSVSLGGVVLEALKAGYGGGKYMWTVYQLDLDIPHKVCTQLNELAADVTNVQRTHPSALGSLC